MIPYINCPFCWKAIPVSELPQGERKGQGFRLPCGCNIKWELYNRMDFARLIKHS